MSQELCNDVFVLCTNEPIGDNNILSPITTIPNLILYKVNKDILTNPIHKINSQKIMKKDIEQYNIYNYNLVDVSIIIPILNIKFIDLIEYLNQYNNTLVFKLTKIYKVLQLNMYFNDVIFDTIENILLSSTLFWSNVEKLNYTAAFINREFISTKNTLTYTFTYYKYNKYIDIIDSKLKIVSNNENIDMNIVAALLNIENVKQRNYIFTFLLLDIDICNDIITNYNILMIMYKDIINHMQLYKYIFMYLWIKLYYDECNKSPKKNYIFELNTAALLPQFEISIRKHNYNHNPYISLLVDPLYLKSLIGIQYYDNNLSKLYLNNILTLCEFRERFNIFTTGNIHYNLFDNYNFKDNNAYIIGSSLVACIQRKTILHELCNNNFKDFINKYYSTADIDIVFIEPNCCTFMKNVNNLIIQLNKNIKLLNNLSNHEFDIQINKIAHLTISKSFIKQHININIVKYHCNYTKLKNACMPYYTKLLTELFNTYSEQEKLLYPEVFNSNNIIYKVKLSDIDIPTIRLDYNIKYIIKSSYLLHQIEIFNIDSNIIDFITNVHLPCTRLYYNGENVYMLPSCITAHLTYMNIDYKYFYGKNNIIDILLKYKLRGFNIYLNQREYSYIKKNKTDNDTRPPNKLVDVKEPYTFMDYDVKPSKTGIDNQGNIIPIDTSYIKSLLQ